jgi:CHAT domain-containing protein
MGYGAFQQGDFERAAQLLGRAEGDPALPSGAAARARAARAQALHYLGDYGAAAEAFARAARALPHGSGARLRALAGCSHALAFAGRAKEAAEQHAAMASELPAAPEAERGELARMLELERALSLLLAGRGPEAERTLLDLAGAALAAGDLATGTIARINLAEWLNDTGRPGPALEQATGALAFIDVGRQPDAGWQALTEKGRALAALGDPRAAQAAFAAAMDLVERLRARIGAEGARRSFLAAKTRLYQAAVALSASGGRPEAAFEISERARARAFLDQIGERWLRLARPEDQHRFDEARRLRLRALPPPLLSVESAFALAPAPVLAGGMDPDPRKGWLSLAQVNPARLSDVQKALHANEMLLSYFHDGQRLHRFAVGRRSFSAAAVEIPAPELEGRVAGLLRSLQQPQRGTELLREKARELRRLLIEPLDASLAKTTRLTIVPWGPLHRLPMGTLWDGKRYLAEQFEISLAPSASTLVLIRSRPASAGGEVLALGNPRTDLPDLPASQEEARQVARNFPGAVLRLGEQATKQALIEHSGSARLLHLSAHGVFLPQRPLDSYLALAGATPETGRLKGIEVLGLDLARQPLVVLSACASGQAESQGAEEWLGLSRAFLQAGASALLASLWNVADDGTAELFGAFYRTLKSGRAPASALAAAARTLIRSREFSHPFYWAAFQAIGG